MVTAARINYLLLVAVGVFWILSGLFYLSGSAGTFEFSVLGVRTENFHVLFGIFEMILGLFWLYIVISRSNGEVSITRQTAKKG